MSNVRACLILRGALRNPGALARTGASQENPGLISVDTLLGPPLFLQKPRIRYIMLTFREEGPPRGSRVCTSDPRAAGLPCTFAPHIEQPAQARFGRDLACLCLVAASVGQRTPAALRPGARRLASFQHHA